MIRRAPFLAPIGTLSEKEIAMGQVFTKAGSVAFRLA
jgi:hypothetical protein